MATLCYTPYMSTCCDNKLTYHGITFQLSCGAAIDEREIHSYHEILYCIDASATLLYENGQKEICGGELLVIPKETYHFFELEDAEKFTRLKISFFDDSIRDLPFSQALSKMRIFQGYSEQAKRILGKLYEILNGMSHAVRGVYAYSAFLMLLSELEIGTEAKETGTDDFEGDLISSAVEYISKNLSSDLSIETIAKHLHASASGIVHNFKKRLGISVHKYVVQKRLICAQGRLREGAHPSKIYLECGYKDYSCFYKAYVSHFGYPPCEEWKKARGRINPF